MGKNIITSEQIKTVTLKLLQYCQINNWAGYDPYDALNSRILRKTPLAKSRFCRLALTQAMKRLPINLRPVLGIPKTQNPKALAIFLKSLIKLSRTQIINCPELISYLLETIIQLRSEGLPYHCWGYSFPWQTRTMLVPRGAPNLVCTVFVAESLLDAWEMTENPACLEMAKSAADYIATELFWSDGRTAGFSYPQPSHRVHIYNADFLAGALLSRMYHLTGKGHYLERALEVVRQAASQQNADGSWYYGESQDSRWIDNFHTGYNLMALKAIIRYARTDEFNSQLKKGFDFYRLNFFREDGCPKYYHNKTYPIDIHCVAQSIITLESFKEEDGANREKALSVLKWALENMWSDKGYFYYQSHRWYKNRISYMRWSQAWMLLALATLLENFEIRKNAVRGWVNYSAR